MKKWLAVLVLWPGLALAQDRPPQILLDLISAQVAVNHLDGDIQGLMKEKAELLKQIEELKAKCGEPCADKR